MSYNTDLQSKNARIQALIDKVNALPEAGGVVANAEILTWTPTSDTKGTVTLHHSLGVVPDGYVVVQAQKYASKVNGAYPISFNLFDVGLSAADSTYIAPCGSMYGYVFDSNTWYESADLGAFVSDSAITFGTNISANYYVYPAGSTYNVLVYKR